MILNSRAHADLGLQADVCIIGAGPAGITLACELDGTNVKVLLLEAGGTGLIGRASQDPYIGTANTPHPNPSEFRRRAFGGSTTIWGGRCVPLDPIDFERRDYVSDSGWPITYEEMLRHYPKAMAYCDAGLFDFSTRNSLTDARSTLPGLDLSTCGVRTDLIERYSLPTNFGSRYRGLLKRSRNIRVVEHAHTLRLLKESGGDRIVAAECATSPGKTRLVRASTFVLAVGGLETPRLLLASDLEGGGIGNHTDCVGRYYMCHIEGTFGTLRPQTPGTIFDFERTRDNVYSRRKLALTESTQRDNRILNIAFRLHYPDISVAAHGSSVLSAVYLARRALTPEHRRILQYGQLERAANAEASAHLKNIMLGLPSVAIFAARLLARRTFARRKLPYILAANADGSFPLEFNSEQTPCRSSRITLGGTVDGYGTRRMHVDWRVCDTDLDSICKAYRLLRDCIAGTRSSTLEFEDATLRESIARSIPVGGHHIGTARMSSAPTRGVVDTNCRVHEASNLYIAGSAVFPTSGHANPTLTVVALAVRLAHHLKARLAS